MFTFKVYWQVARGIVPALGATSLGMLSSSSCLCLSISVHHDEALAVCVADGRSCCSTLAVSSLLRPGALYIHRLCCVRGAHAHSSTADATCKLEGEPEPLVSADQLSERYYQGRFALNGLVKACSVRTVNVGLDCDDDESSSPVRQGSIIAGQERRVVLLKGW